MTRIIIGMTGKRGSPETGYVQAQAGKDTAATQLIEAHGFTRIALADGVRDSLYALNPCVLVEHPRADLAHLSGPNGQPVGFSPGIPQLLRLQTVVDALGWEEAKKIPEVRALMQRMGTEAGRDIHGETLWTKLVEHKLGKLDRLAPVVVTDVRFPNEADWLRGLGGTVVEVFRPDELSPDLLGSNAKHDSETMGWIHPDAVLRNDGTVEELHDGMDTLLTVIQHGAG